MDSNETIRPLTDAPAQETPEALVATSTTMEESDVTITSLQTKEEVIVTSDSSIVVEVATNASGVSCAGASVKGRIDRKSVV